MFNECLFHLYDCTCSNVMCILNYLLIKLKNIFEYFVYFSKCFYTFVCLEFLFKMCISCFYQKTLLEAFSWVSHKLALPMKMRITKIRKHFNSYREFRDCLARNSYPWKLMSASGIFAGNFARSLPTKSTFLQFLKANSNSFSNICILPPPGLSQPKTHFLSKPHPKLKINHF